jgi:hypothetical protein
MNSRLSVAATMTAMLTQACTGGGITDGQGKNLPSSVNEDLVVNFQSAASGRTYSTGVDNNGYFGFDGNAPSSASNDSVVVPEGNYRVWVSSKTGAPVQHTPFTVNHAFNNTDCPDHYVQGQHEQCALYQLELLGGAVVTPPAPHPANFLGLNTTVIPVSSGDFCQPANLGFGLANMSNRYNDIQLKIYSRVDVAWGWKVTRGNLHASGTIPAGAHGGSIDVAASFTGPPYYVYPNTEYTVSFFAGGLHSSCPAMHVNVKTPTDPVPPCVIDHNCAADPGDGDDFSAGSDCSAGTSCCSSGLCWQADDCPYASCADPK